MAHVQGDFAVGSVKRHVLNLALPMTAAHLINLLYSIVDRMYLGRIPGDGSPAMTGVGLVLPVISIFMSAASLCGMGGAPLFSIARGRGDDTEAEKTLGNSFTLLLIFGFFFMIAATVFKTQILYLFGASEATFSYASDYLGIYTYGTIFVMISLGLNPFINAQGAAKRGMLSVAIGAAVNLALDPIFIFVLDLGTAGAAFATIIAQFCSAVWVLNYLVRTAELKLRIKNMKLRAHRVFRILTLGAAGFCMNLTNSLIQTVCNRTLLKYGGDVYIGVMTVVNAVREIVFMPVQGVAQGSSPVMSFNFGAEKYDRVRESIRFSLCVNIGYTFTIWAIIMAAPRLLIHMFTPDAAILAAGARSLRIFFLPSVLMSLQMTSQQVFTSLGKSKQAVFFSLLRKAFIAAPLTLLLPAIGFGVDGVFAADAVSQVIGGAASCIVMYVTVYRKIKKINC